MSFHGFTSWQHFIALHSITVQCSELNCTALHFTALHCISLYCTVLNRATFFYRYMLGPVASSVIDTRPVIHSLILCVPNMATLRPCVCLTYGSMTIRMGRAPKQNTIQLRTTLQFMFYKTCFCNAPPSDTLLEEK